MFLPRLLGWLLLALLLLPLLPRLLRVLDPRTFAAPCTADTNRSPSRNHLPEVEARVPVDGGGVSGGRVGDARGLSRGEVISGGRVRREIADSDR